MCVPTGRCAAVCVTTLSADGRLSSNMAADSGMDTCPSPEIADSRKRPLDGDNENGDTKRSHFSTGNVNISTLSCGGGLTKCYLYTE